MKTWKLLTAAIGWCCLLWSTPAAAQQPDTAALRPLTLREPFPYPVGVAMTWLQYQQARRSAELADSLITQKGLLVGGLRYQVHEGELLYSAAAKRADDAQRAADRKDVVIDQLHTSLIKARRQGNRPLLLRPSTWGVAGVSFCVGFVVGAGVIAWQVIQ